MRLLFVAMLILSSTFSQASTIKLNYSVFFSYMKTMYKLDYAFVTTAFYLVDRTDKRLCTIKNAQISMEGAYEPILFQSEGRLLPFYSDQYRKDGAVLEVEIADDEVTSNCDLQITVMAKESELFDLNEQKLIIISDQLEGVLNKNAGMIGKYFLPAFAGIRLHFSNALNESQLATLGEVGSIASNGDLLLGKASFSLINKINKLNLSVVRITPWMLNK